MAAVHGFINGSHDPFYHNNLMMSQQRFMQGIHLPDDFVSAWDDEDHPENFVPGPEDEYRPVSNLDSWEDEDLPENIPPPESIQSGGHGDDLQESAEEFIDEDFVDFYGELVEVDGEVVRIGDALALIQVSEGFDRRSDLSEEIIQQHLNTRKYEKIVNQDADEDVDICVVCQIELEGEEIMGTLGCGHEFHADCIKRWLLEKNECPICKRVALQQRSKESFGSSGAIAFELDFVRASQFMFLWIFGILKKDIGCNSSN